MPTFTVRIAEEHDAEAMRALVAFTEPDGVDENSTDGAVIAEVDGAVVGFARLVMLTADEAWLDRLVVEPTWRGRGIGTTLLRTIMDDATAHSATILRAHAVGTATPAQSLLRRAGFTQVGGYARFIAKTAGARPDLYAGPLISQPDTTALDRLWDWFSHSNLIPLIGGVMLDGSRAHSLTDEALARALAERRVWTVSEWDEFQSIAIVAPYMAGDGLFAMSLLDGAVDGLGRIALFLRAHAATLGAELIEVRVPELLIIFDALDGAGFTRDGEISHQLFAKTLS